MKIFNNHYACSSAASLLRSLIIFFNIILLKWLHKCRGVTPCWNPLKLVDKLPVHSAQQWAGHLLSAHWSCCEHQSLRSQSQNHPTLLVSGDKGENRDKGRTSEKNEKPTQEPGGWKNVCGCACMLSAVSKKQLRNVLLLIFHPFPGSEFKPSYKYSTINVSPL